MTAGRPRVSICIPAYNQPESLRRALDSIRLQNFAEYEVIVTDDSGDESVREVAESFDLSGKLVYRRNPEPLGSPGNWNAAVALASGYYVKILHHDDWFRDTESLGGLVELMDRNPGASLGFCSSLNVRDDGSMWVHSASEDRLASLREDPSVLFCGNFIGSPSATILRAPLRHGFDTRLKWVVDIDFYIRVLSDSPDIAYHPEPLVCISEAGESRVTSECRGNKAVEVGEYVYLFARLAESRRPTPAQKRFLRDIFLKHGIRSSDDIAQCCPDAPVTPAVSAVLDSIGPAVEARYRLEKWFKSTRQGKEARG